MSRSVVRSLIIFLAFLLCQDAHGQLIAGFTASDTAGCNPFIVHFTNTSLGATSYSWDLGNGTLTTATDASASYLSVGAYTVTMTASNGTTSATKTMVVRAYDKPTVNFTASSTTLCTNSPVTFTSTSTSGSWGALAYTWNFGDGSSSTLNSPTYSYSPPGYYNISLYATNTAGCVSSLTKGTYIHVLNPSRIKFSAANTYFCTVPATANFTNSTTGTTPLSYVWDFGDGSPTTTATSPAHTYTATGSYNVKLKVTDGNGCTDSLVQNSYITIGHLTAEFSSISQECVNIPVTFADTSKSVHISRVWDFGDKLSGSFDTEYHAFTTGGIFNVKLVIYDGFCYDSIIHPVTIYAPTGTITSTQPCTPLSTLSFAASVSAGASIAWDFGDTKTGTGLTATHTYNTKPLLIDPPPVYTVNMTLTDTHGCINTISQTDTIYNLWLDNSSTAPTEGCAPLLVDFTAVAKSTIINPHPVDFPTDRYIVLPYYRSISTYLWDFGDGSPTSALTAPRHTYAFPGTYTARCHIVTANGCTMDSSLTIKVGYMIPTAFTMSRTHACGGVPITYKAVSPSPLIDYYLWGFDDGNSSSGKASDGFDVVVDRAEVPGIHHPHLSVSYNGCATFPPSSLTDTIDVPNATISYTHTCIPANGIAFADASIGDSARLWLFGDGTTSTLQNPVHYYPALKMYTATITTYNTTNGCRDTGSVDVYLQRLKGTILPFHASVCPGIIDSVVDSIRNVMGPSAPATFAAGSVWYINGTASDTTTPAFPSSYGITNWMSDTVVHAFPAKGTNNVTVIVTDNNGCLDTFSKNITVAKPTANFTASFVNGCSPVPASYVDKSTDVTGATIIRYDWAFGDGALATLTVPTTTHDYRKGGTFTITEIVTDDVGCSDTLKSSVRPVVYKPIAIFTASDTVNCLGSNVGFSNTSTGTSKWLWSFGDGSTTTVSNPIHIYTTSGLYTVSLIASDAFGCADTLIKTNHITINPLPSASFSMDDSFAVCPPLNVNFSNGSVGATAFQWSFGDGTYSLAASPNAIYSFPGYYTVKLVASNIYGCIDTAIGHASTFGYKGAFSYTPINVCKGLPTHFSAVLSGVASIVWDFGDGTISGYTYLDTITHIYTTPGKYLPKLFLVDSTGCNNFSYGADTIKVDTMVPNFTFLPNPGCQNTSITFHDSSYSYYSSSAVWLWSFGSGATSTLSTPTYTYTVSGIQTVMLTVTDSAGCNSTISKSVKVNPGPVAITGVASVCTGQSTVLTDASSGGTWVSSNTAIATVGAGVVTGVANGTSTITYTLSSGCNVTATTTVYPAPVAIGGPGDVCIGLTIKLSDATTGGLWSSSNTSLATVGTASGIVTGVAAGTLTVSYTLGTGCTSMKTVTVNSLPLSITGTKNVCKGLTTALSDVSAGGAWSSGNTAILTVGSGSGIVTGIAAGTNTITYKLGTGCITTATVLVNTLPLAITGTTNTCVGQSATLSDGTTGGTWTSSATAIATIGSASGTFSGIAPGTATITYTLGSGCLISKTITVNPLPASITGNTQVCAGLTTTLSNTTAGGTWSSGSTAIATVGSSSGTLTGKLTGTTTITYSLGTGCTVNRVETVNPIPVSISGTTRVCTGFSATLSDASTGGTWSSSPTAIATIGSSTGIYKGITTGTAGVTYTLSSGCQVSGTITILEQPAVITGIKNVCAGLTTTLSDSVSGGTWSTGSTSISLGSTTGIVTGITAGTAVVSYTLGGTCVAIATTTVNPLPVAITGINHVCVGLTTPLSDSDPGGTWASSAGAVATIGSANGIVSGVFGGTSTITYELATGCKTNTTVTVNPLPTGITGVASLCAGQTTTLSDATGGGTWSCSGTSVATIGSATAIVNGIKAGTATITYTLNTGCIITKAVTVNPLPAAIKGLTEVCQGLTTTLTDADAGGAWTSGNTTIAAIGSASGIASGISAGTTTIAYTLNTGCSTNTTITVKPLPATITGTAVVCSGGTVTVSDADAGGSWTSGNSTIAAINSANGTITGGIAGTATITYTLPTGCINTTTVLVNPLPAAITGTKSVCLGSAMTLSDPTPGGSWSNTGTAIAIGSGSGTVTGVSAGTATVTYTLSTGCIIAATVTVNPLPEPISGNFNVCKGLTTVLSDDTPGGIWNCSDPKINIGTTTGIVTGLSLGTATVSYKLPTGCFVTGIVTVNQLPSVVTGTIRVCLGAITALSDSLSGGTWSSSNTAIVSVNAAGVAKGEAAGSATISYTSAFGCVALTSVTVDPLKEPITGKTTLCKGDVTMLSNAITGGVWTSSDPSVVTVSTSGVVTAVATGEADISYVAINVCGTASTHITVNPLPDAGTIKGPLKLCSGTSVVLTDTVANGVWASGNDVTATVDATGSVSGLTAGTVVISYAYTNSCGTAKTWTTLTINQTPYHPHITTHPDTALCNNTLFQNFATNTPEPPGMRYTWSATNAVVYATAANRLSCLVSFTLPGTSIIRLATTQSNTDCRSEDSLLFHLNDHASPLPVVVYYHPEFVCKDNTAGAYQWGYDDVITLDSTLLPGMVNMNYENANPDFSKKNYWVMTWHNGCMQKSYYNPPTAVSLTNSENNIEILLYPNPAEEKINIEVKGGNRTDVVEAKLFDILGKEREKIILTNGIGSIKLNTYTPAVYMIMITKDGVKIGTRTFVKER